MARDVERFLRIEHQTKAGWHTIPLGQRVRVWETSKAVADDGAPLVLFHVGYLDGLSKGQRVSYLGQILSLVDVSDSKRLVGLELTCHP